MLNTFESQIPVATTQLRMVTETLPYWLVNVPKDQWRKECPEFLKSIGPRDQQMISTPESQFHRLTWPEVQDIIGAKTGNL